MSQAGFLPTKLWRGVFAGSGSDALREPRLASEIVKLTGKTAVDIRVAYIGTASYDLDAPRKNQTGLLEKMGCQVLNLILADPDTAVNMKKVGDMVKAADVIIASGGNTLYAMNRWKHLGVDKLLLEARDRGVVLAGGSAGAICWFDSGHSDSMDPDSFRAPMIATYNQNHTGDESTGAPESVEDVKDWKYIRIGCLGLYPGLVCPHHDKTQSNGVLRAIDFDEMLKRHKGERGLGIDHWAALVVDGERYKVLSLPEKPGSLLPNKQFSSAADGIPWIWSKSFDHQTDSILSVPLKEEGLLVDVLKVAEFITRDPLEEECTLLNPAHS